MHPQNLLINLARQYDLDTASQLLSNTGIRQFVRGWLALDLSIPLSKMLKADSVKFAEPYHSNDLFFKYCAEEDSAEPCEKRSASKADLMLSVEDVDHFFEFHYLHQSQISNSKIMNKLYLDMDRVRAMRNMHSLNVNLVVALWGSFNGNDIEVFKPVDLNRDAVYALDTSLLGSSQVARLVHIRKAGEPRLVLAAG